MNILLQLYQSATRRFAPSSILLFTGILPLFVLPQWLAQFISVTSTPVVQTETTYVPYSDSTDCNVAVALETTTDFVPVVQCRFDHPGIITYQPPMFADIDGDGETEIVILLDHSPNGFAVINPITCEAEHIVDVGEDMWYKDGGIVLGDVDRNGRADIFIPAGTRLQRWEFSPTTGNMEKIWQTDNNVIQAERAHLDIYDLNQDGEPEIIPNIGHMVNAVTGQVYGDVVPALNRQGKGLFAFTADAITEPAPEGFGNVELLYGTQIWRYNFRDQYWFKVSSLPGFEHWGRDACVSIADMDLDGDVDAVVTHYDEAYSGEAVIWDLQTETILGGEGAWDYPSTKGSRMNISNLDDDPYPEMVMTSRFTIFAVDDIVNSDGFGNIIWLDQTTDESGHTQLTSFDFDGNGTYEIAYRDETHLRIFSGLGTGIPTGEYPSSAEVLLNTGVFNSCQSYTGMEYPTIGDVDQDGQAEMVATCGGYLSVYESGSLPWRNATRVWNTQAFTVTNVNQDGTIPSVMTENHTLFNNFLAQVTEGGVRDSVQLAVPDALVTITEIRNDCGESVQLDLEICNQGAAPLRQGTPIAIYQQNPTATAATMAQLNQVPVQLEIGLCTNITIYNLPAPPINEDVHYFVVVNDGGQIAPPYVLDTQSNGGTFPVTDIIECNYLNNIADSLIRSGVESASQIDTTICAGETFYVGQAAYTEAGIYINTIPNATGCDSLVTLNLDVKPAATSYLTTEICSGSTFTYFDGQVFRDTGVFYDTLTATNGCDSIAALDLTLLPILKKEIDAVICPGESYAFANQNLTTSGTYVDSLVAQTGCDSVVTLNLTLSESMESALQQAGICDSEFYTFGERQLTESGMYFDTLQNVFGCDSIIALELTVKQPIYVDLNEKFCLGSGYSFDNQWLTTAGVYTARYPSYDGCDSIVTLNLFAFPSFERAEMVTICQGETYLLGEEELTDGGYYVRNLSTQAGCDSTITLSLNVIGATYNPADQTICQGERIFFGDRELRTAGRYLDTLTSVMTGCDSIVHLTLNVLDAPNESLTVDLCAGETFELNGEVYDRGGNYSQFFTAVNGCDSIVNLQINLTPNTTFAEQITICAGESYQVGNEVYNETGMYETVLSNAQNCDSLHQLSLFVLPSFSVELNTQICAGEAYLMGETEYTESGIYQQQFIAQNGCDSLVNLTLEVVDGYAIETQAAICAGESYEWNGETYTESGAYRDELTASSGCDSLIALVLEILPVYETTAEQQICAGESFDWEGETLTAAGEYTKTLTATTGCDSTVTLQLAITENVENQIFANICAGESYEWNGTTYGEAGTYEQTFTSAANCDSTVALMLFIIPEQRQRIDATTCEGHPYPFGDQMLWTPGLYTRTFTAASGCDSIVELFLAIERNTATIAQQTICEGEMVAFGTRELRIAGEYIDTLVAANGCDSFAVMQLSVLPAPNASESATICEGESYRFDGQELTESGTYERTVSADNGCNGVITLALEVLTNPETFLQQQICPDDSYFFNNEEVIERGIYEMVLPAANGCDSIVYLDLEILEDAVAILNPQICAGDSYRAGDTEFSESGTFTLNLTAANGCDSTLTINLAVLPNIINDMSVSICEGDSYQVGANEYSEAGVYRDTLSSENGCDSIVVLGLEVLPSPTVNDVQTICKGESYLLNGREYTVAGNYLERMETVAGCDSVVYLQLTVLPVEESYLPVTICAGETYALGNRIYDAAGTYMDTLTASTGCDSVILLEISELEVVYTAQQVSICTGENYIFNNETLTETGIYTQRYTAQNGCDSTVELTLEVFENIAINVNRTICAGEAIEIAGVAYSESGIYTNELQNINGCDSIVTLELRVLETETIREVVEMCAGSSYKFYGEEYTNSGTYEVRIPNENGCEDTAILVLTELPAINETVSATLCQGDTYRFGENELSTAGVYYDTLVSVNFCDSIVQLQLSVNEPTEQLLNLSICEGDSILIAGAYRMAADFFEENLITSYGCDSIVYTQLTVVPNIAIEAYGGEICAGDSIQIGVQGASEYEWFPKEGLSCTDCAEPMVAPTETTTYTVRVRGCLDEILEEQVTVVVKEASQLSITPAQEIVFGQSVTLEVFTDAFDPFIYWTIDDKIFCSECESITVSPQENVTYVVTVETEDGCVLQEEVDVTVRKNCIESDFFIPNMISPNGDGANDEFYIETDIPSNLKHLRIYDRWGEMMFETDDWETHWNGNFRGKAVNPGVYVYYLEAVCPNNEPFKKVGNITVLK